jgi:hypothetical protein
MENPRSNRWFSHWNLHFFHHFPEDFPATFDDTGWSWMVNSGAKFTRTAGCGGQCKVNRTRKAMVPPKKCLPELSHGAWWPMMAYPSCWPSSYNRNQ